MQSSRAGNTKAVSALLDRDWRMLIGGNAVMANDGATMEMRASSGGKYVSLTCIVKATSKPQLDALYMELMAHPLVKIVL